MDRESPVVLGLFTFHFISATFGHKHLIADERKEMESEESMEKTGRRLEKKMMINRRQPSSPKGGIMLWEIQPPIGDLWEGKWEVVNGLET